MRIRQTTASAFVLPVELGQRGSKQQDADHVFGVRDDALLHQMIGAFQGGRHRRIFVGTLATRVGRAPEHAGTDFDREESGVVDGLEALQIQQSQTPGIRRGELHLPLRQSPLPPPLRHPRLCAVAICRLPFLDNVQEQDPQSYTRPSGGYCQSVGAALQR